MALTPSHRGGIGPPLVLLHGFADSWRTWELVLPALERRHDVLALTLAGHAGGPPIEGRAGAEALVDAVERAMDEAGLATAHLAGNSLGGYLALRLAERGRARSVVAFAPAGGWAPGDESYRGLLARQSELAAYLKTAAPQASAILSTREGRRRATSLITTNYEHIPMDLLAHQMLAGARCDAALPLIEAVLSEGWSLDASMAIGRGALPRGAAPRRLGGARRRGPLPAARRAARGGGADPHVWRIVRSRTAMLGSARSTSSISREPNLRLKG